MTVERVTGKIYDGNVPGALCLGRGISNDGQLLYIENKLMNNSSAYWVQSIFYSIEKGEFCALLEHARKNGYVEKAIKGGQTTEKELEKLGGHGLAKKVYSATI